jgi:hypothetical protein
MQPVRTLGLLALVLFFGASAGTPDDDGDGLLGLLLGSRLDRLEEDGSAMVSSTSQVRQCTAATQVYSYSCTTGLVGERGESLAWSYSRAYLSLQLRAMAIRVPAAGRGHRYGTRRGLATPRDRETGPATCHLPIFIYDHQVHSQKSSPPGPHFGSSVNIAACHHPAWLRCCSLTNETRRGYGV